MKKMLKGIALATIAGSMMGNTSCQEQQPRELKRRVQMGKVSAPAIQLPQGGTFNFEEAVNTQMYTVLAKAFSTAKIDPSQTYNPSGLSDDQKEVFNQCGDEPAMSGNQKIMEKSIITRESACMIDLPQGVISGNIIDFTLTDSGGASISMAQIPFAPSASFNVKSYELSLGMKALHPLIPGGNVAGDKMVIAANLKESYGQEWGASLGLTYSMLGLGLNYYNKTPMRQITEEGLTAGIQDLKAQWDKAEPWYAMVLRNCDKYIYINAGSSSDAGLVEGDIVKIQNMDYEWSGDVCKSTLLGTNPYIGGPVAYARVKTVGNTISTAELIENDPAYPHKADVIRPGARVYLEKLFVPEKQAAK